MTVSSRYVTFPGVKDPAINKEEMSLLTEMSIIEIILTEMSIIDSFVSSLNLILYSRRYLSVFVSLSVSALSGSVRYCLSLLGKVRIGRPD